MNVNVALNGSLERNLAFFSGDEQTLTLTVYESDGDEDALAVTDPRILTCFPSLTIPVEEEFVVPDDCPGRTQYRLVAEVAGVTTTLAYGTMTIRGGTCCDSTGCCP